MSLFQDFHQQLEALYSRLFPLLPFFLILTLRLLFFAFALVAAEEYVCGAQGCCSYEDVSRFFAADQGPRGAERIS